MFQCLHRFLATVHEAMEEELFFVFHMPLQSFSLSLDLPNLGEETMHTNVTLRLPLVFNLLKI